MEKADFITEKITWWYNSKMNWSAMDPGNKEDFVKRVSTALIYEDKEEGIFTMSLLERGGPIIMAPTIEEVKEKFMEAFAASIAIASLRGFSKKK